MDRAAHAFLRDLCSSLSFVALVRQLLFLMAPLDLASASCMAAIRNTLAVTGDLTVGRAAGHHLLVRAATLSVLLRTALAAGTLFVMRHRRSISELPAATGRWCRRAIFTAVIVHALALLCIISFAAATIRWRMLFVATAAEAMTGLSIVAFGLIATYTAMYAD